jgi:hypothetical protein
MWSLVTVRPFNTLHNQIHKSLSHIHTYIHTYIHAHIDIVYMSNWQKFVDFWDRYYRSGDYYDGNALYEFFKKHFGTEAMSNANTTSNTKVFDLTRSFNTHTHTHSFWILSFLLYFVSFWFTLKHITNPYYYLLCILALCYSDRRNNGFIWALLIPYIWKSHKSLQRNFQCILYLTLSLSHSHSYFSLILSHILLKWLMLFCVCRLRPLWLCGRVVLLPHTFLLSESVQTHTHTQIHSKRFWIFTSLLTLQHTHTHTHKKHKTQ